MIVVIAPSKQSHLLPYIAGVKRAASLCVNPSLSGMCYSGFLTSEQVALSIKTQQSQPDWRVWGAGAESVV